MTFHPEHMTAGIKAAIASPNTPEHLKPHLQNRLAGGSMKPKLPKKLAAPAMGGINPVATPRMPVVGKAPKAKKFGKGSAVSAVDNAKPLLPAAFYGQ